MGYRPFTLLAGTALLVTSATARQRNVDPAETAPGKVVCRSQEVLGSLLRQGERCMTNAEWREMKRLQQEIERIQSVNWKNG